MRTISERTYDDLKRILVALEDKLPDKGNGEIKRKARLALKYLKTRTKWKK